jgi:hypothetical protein
MATVLDLQDNIKAINVHVEAKSAIGRTAESYVELNREQLLEGYRADGSQLPDYSWISVKKYGKPEGPIRLFDTGAFHGSFKLDVGGEDTELIANDEHNLEERYGDEIFGLTSNSQEYYNQEIFYPEFAESLESLTGLSII